MDYRDILNREQNQTVSLVRVTLNPNVGVCDDITFSVVKKYYGAAHKD